jgi:hypothetical protein
MTAATAATTTAVVVTGNTAASIVAIGGHIAADIAAFIATFSHGTLGGDDNTGSFLLIELLNDIRSSRDLHSRTDAILEMTKIAINTDNVHFVRSARRKTAERSDLTQLMAKRVR